VYSARQRLSAPAHSTRGPRQSFAGIFFSTPNTSAKFINEGQYIAPGGYSAKNKK
jgi:hypothetical protein